MTTPYNVVQQTRLVFLVIFLVKTISQTRPGLHGFTSIKITTWTVGFARKYIHGYNRVLCVFMITGNAEMTAGA